MTSTSTLTATVRAGGSFAPDGPLLPQPGRTAARTASSSGLAGMSLKLILFTLTSLGRGGVPRGYMRRNVEKRARASLGFALVLAACGGGAPATAPPPPADAPLTPPAAIAGDWPVARPADVGLDEAS